jgi:Domain of unknown function (DUF1993)
MAVGDSAHRKIELKLGGREVQFEGEDYPFNFAFYEIGRRVERTLEYIAGVPAASISESASRRIVLKLGGSERGVEGKDYLFNFGLPNFFFHVTTAYDILRHAGLNIGRAIISASRSMSTQGKLTHSLSVDSRCPVPLALDPGAGKRVARVPLGRPRTSDGTAVVPATSVTGLTNGRVRFATGGFVP